MEIQGDMNLPAIVRRAYDAEGEVIRREEAAYRLPERYESALKARLELDVIETDRKRRLREAQVDALDLDTRERLLIKFVVREAVAHALAVERLNVRFPR